MKTSIPSSAEWASKQLDLEKSLGTDISLLKYVEAENFLLSDLESEALDILSENNDTSEYYQNFRSEELHKEIISFRKNFFAIPISERREKQKELESLAESSLSSKAMLHELRLGVFIDIKQIPEENKVINFIERAFTASPQDRGIILDEVDRRTEEEKKELYKDYQDLLNFDSDLHRLCPHLENILNPPVVEEVRQKSKNRGGFGRALLIFIVIYFLYKLITLGLERSAEEENQVPSSEDNKEETKKTDKKEIDKFLEYMEGKAENEEETPNE